MQILSEGLGQRDARAEPERPCLEQNDQEAKGAEEADFAEIQRSLQDFDFESCGGVSTELCAL